jgi:hypothetical protein
MTLRSRLSTSEAQLVELEALRHVKEEWEEAAIRERSEREISERIRKELEEEILKERERSEKLIEECERERKAVEDLSMVLEEFQEG